MFHPISSLHFILHNMWGRREMHEGLWLANLMAKEQLGKHGVNGEIYKNGSDRNKMDRRAKDSYK
jgi:hypothetical protein